MMLQQQSGARQPPVPSLSGQQQPQCLESGQLPALDRWRHGGSDWQAHVVPIQRRQPLDSGGLCRAGHATVNPRRSLWPAGRAKYTVALSRRRNICRLYMHGCTIGFLVFCNEKQQCCCPEPVCQPFSDLCTHACMPHVVYAC
jgi:hypothetical protein